MVRELGQHVAIALLVARVATAGEVAGRFSVGERAIAPKHAAAYPVRDSRDPRKIAIEVVLSEGTVDAAEAVLALDPHTHAINQESLSRGNYVMLWVRPDGEVSMNATFAKTMVQYVDGTRGLLKGLVADLTANDAERVAGRVRTREPVKLRSGESYALDVTFATAITRAPAGTPIAAGGGEPGKALEALHGAIEAKDWTALRAALSAKRRASFEADYRSAEENLAYAIDILRAWLPKAAWKIGAGELRGDEATLDLEGEPWPGKAALYRVRMLREDGAWRFDQGVLAGLL